MICSIMITAIVSVAIVPVNPNTWVSVLLKLMAGMYLGLRLTTSLIKKLKSYIFLIGIVIFWMMLATLVLGVLLYQLGNMNETTALLAATPGGISDIILISNMMSGDMTIVAIFQLVRLFSVCLVFPPIYKWLSKWMDKKTLSVKKVKLVSEGLTNKKEVKIIGYQSFIKIFLTMSISGICGILLMKLNFPAGALLGSMLGCMITNELKITVLPKHTKHVVQIGAGILVGSKMNLEVIQSLSNFFLPIVALILGQLLSTIVLAYIIHRRWKIDFITILMAVSPGGIQELGIMAQDMNCDLGIITLFHTVRLISVVMFFPSMIAFITA